MRPSPTMELHLRIRILPGKRDEFLTFLRAAIPVYERPGDIRIRLLEDASDDHRFIEVVEYVTPEAYQRDQDRVAHDPELKALLERWRTHLDGPPQLEVYSLAR
jgi:quinol monooxygenase YgiN